MANNHLLIYLIVALNAACHPMLIWRLKLGKRVKVKFSILALGIPVLIMLAMRLMVAAGVVHGQVAEQVGIEHILTTLASMLLIVGPVLATAAAIVFSRKHPVVLAQS